MITVDPHEASVATVQSYFQGVIAPRPIALASTTNAAGLVNLSPFSFFNIFSNRPPVLIFSPARRGRNNTPKHTYENVLEVPEVVINIVNYDMVEQVSLSSVEYARDVDEFVKSGLTPLPSLRVKPPRVAESPASFECAVTQILPLGDQGGAGILVICEVLLAHFKEELFDAKGVIDPTKLDAVGRMGNDYYCRANGENIFVVPKPHHGAAIGVDQIPASVRKSNILTGNDLGRLGNVESLPAPDVIEKLRQFPEVQQALSAGEEQVHRLAQRMLREGKAEAAWGILLLGGDQK